MVKHKVLLDKRHSVVRRSILLWAPGATQHMVCWSTYTKHVYIVFSPQGSQFLCCVAYPIADKLEWITLLLNVLLWESDNLL